MTINSNARYQLHPAARFRVLDDEGIFVLQEAREVLTVNRVGALVVEELCKDRTVSEVVDRLIKRFAVEQEVARSDLDALVTELVEAKALSSK